jgi:hypothetical protein
MLQKHTSLKVGDKVYVEIVDELPDGDGKVFFKGIGTISRIVQNKYIYFEDVDLIAKFKEVKRVIKK